MANKDCNSLRNHAAIKSRVLIIYSLINLIQFYFPANDKSKNERGKKVSKQKSK